MGRAVMLVAALIGFGGVVLGPTWWLRLLALCFSLLAVLLWVWGTLVTPLKDALRCLTALERGSILVSLADLHHPWLRSAKEAIQIVLRQLYRLLATLSISADETLHGVQQMSQTATEVEELAQNGRSLASTMLSEANSHVAVLGHAGTVIDQLAAGIADLSGRAEALSLCAAHASQQTESGSMSLERVSGQVETMQQAVVEGSEALEQLLRSSRNIERVVALIEEIAHATNLLALNAGIESARSGEAGKGFGVIATEIRQLANRSRERISDVRAELARVTEGVARVEATMKRVQEEAHKGTALLAAAQDAFVQIHAATEETDATAEAISHEVKDLAALGERSSALQAEMRESVRRSVDAIQAAAAAFEKQGERLGAVTESAKHLLQLVDDMQARTVGQIDWTGVSQRIRPLAEETLAVLYREYGSAALAGTSGDSLRALVQRIAQQHPEYELVYALDARGAVEASSRPTTVMDVSFRQYYQAPRAGKSYISEPYLSAASFNPVFTVAIPLYDGGGVFCGVLSVDRPIAAADPT